MLSFMSKFLMANVFNLNIIYIFSVIVTKQQGMDLKYVYVVIADQLIWMRIQTLFKMSSIRFHFISNLESKYLNYLYIYNWNALNLLFGTPNGQNLV